MKSPMLAWGLMALMLLSTAACVRAEDVEDSDEYEDVVRAHLIVRKSVANEVAVAGRNITVTLDMYNTGSGSAKNVRVSDMLPAGAKLLSGSLQSTIASIAEGSKAQVSYSITFPVGGSQVILMPASVVYTAEEGSEQHCTSSIERIFVMTPVQHITRHAVSFGTYASFGFCRSPTDWRNLLIVLLLVGAVVGGNFAMTRAATATSSRKRKAALKELEKEK